jgi:hypothetical protein
MKLFDNFLNLNIQKLFLKGDIANAYRKMYELAEEIANHELKQKRFLIADKASKKFEKDPSNLGVFEGEVTRYKEKRIDYHMNKMKELLKLREQIISDKNAPKEK